MHKFFQKYEVDLDEGDAIDCIVSKAKKAKHYYKEDEDYETCLQELSVMVDDFFRFKTEM